MKPKNGEWLIYPSPSESVAGITTIYTGYDGSGNMVGQIAEIYGSDKDAQAIAKLMASAPAMLEVLKNAEGVVRLTSPSMADTIKEQIAKAEGQEPPVITGDKDTDELLEIERCNQEDKPWEMGTDQEGILMLDCEHKNKPIYQPEEKDTGIPESYTCDDCGKEFDIPEPDFDLMNKE